MCYVCPIFPIEGFLNISTLVLNWTAALHIISSVVSSGHRIQDVLLLLLAGAMWLVSSLTLALSLALSERLRLGCGGGACTAGFVVTIVHVNGGWCRASGDRSFEHIS